MKRLTLISEGKVFPVDVSETSGRIQLTLSGESLNAQVGNHSGGGVSLLLGHHSYEAQVSVQERQIAVQLEGERFVFEIDDGQGAGARAPSERHQGVLEVRAPMPGKVAKLLVSRGDSVKAGQGVLLFEAMKMQNEIRSPSAGQIVELAVAEGQTVESRERLFAVKSV